LPHFLQQIVGFTTTSESCTFWDFSLMKFIHILITILLFLQPPLGGGPGGGNGNGRDPCQGPHPPPSCGGPPVPIEGEAFLVAGALALYFLTKRKFNILILLRRHSYNQKNNTNAKEGDSDPAIGALHQQ
jgi:hypothetical protein